MFASTCCRRESGALWGAISISQRYQVTMSTPKCSFNDGQIEGKALTRAEGEKKQTEDNISFYSEGCIDVCSHGLQSKKNTALKMMCCCYWYYFLTGSAKSSTSNRDKLDVELFCHREQLRALTMRLIKNSRTSPVRA